MVQKPKAVKYKVVAGYLLLFAAAVVSVWFFYNEILRIAIPAKSGEDNSKIIKVSNVITDLYASEAVGRSAILTGSVDEYLLYNRMIDSITTKIDTIKNSVEERQVAKFDSIRMLLGRKKKSISDIFIYRKKYTAKDIGSSAKEKIYYTKDSLWDAAKPVRSTKTYSARPLVHSALTPKLLDSLSKLELSGDSLTIAYNKALDILRRKDERLRINLLRQEQRLLDENRIISDQLRVILASVEEEFLQKSYAKIDESRTAIAETVRKMAWIGAITLFFMIVFAWFIIRDLTTNQNYRKQLEILNRENENLLRSKSMLMATVTHDLQTPLGSIIGFHDLMKDSGITHQQGVYLGNIRQSADYILKLVNDLLDFSRLENNRITIEMASFNVKSLIESTCMALEPMALKKGIELNWDIEEKLDGNYVSDPYRIKQVLTNLVSNAVKFTNEGSVEVTARIQGFDIYISVLDTGIGIAEDKHDEVFREFTQAHEGIEKKFGGTGLGLTISKKILELLDGHISLESKEGQGSIFTIVIPCIASKIKDTGPEIMEQAPSVRNRTLKNKKILVVDDDATQLALMRELLSGYAGAVRTEINPAAVIALLEEEHFDMVLTDIQMPGLDGFGLVNLIRQHHDTEIALLPVIALSGKRDLTPEDYLEKGFSANHPKPVQFEQLLLLMASVFEGKTDVSDQARQIIVPNSDELYSLKSLSQFTNDDKDSLNTILKTFIESAKDNCRQLVKASGNRDLQQLSEIAHKMIPMLKQMEVHSIVKLLIPLEDKPDTMDWEMIDEYVTSICKKAGVLCEALETEMA